MISNAVRCVPPQNKPTTSEINTCRNHLKARIKALPRLKVVIALGVIAHNSCVKALGGTMAAYKFRHGARHDLSFEGREIGLYDSYHCSRYNTNTGVLTAQMFQDVFATVRARYF